MALPNIPLGWQYKAAAMRSRNVAEMAIVKQRNQDDDYRNRWRDTAKYYRDADVRSQQQKSWTSDKSYRTSMKAFVQEELETADELKKRKMAARRDKLRRLLKSETDGYEVELKGRSRAAPEQLDGMRERAEVLRSAREDERRKVATRRLEEHWKENDPRLREAESRQLQRHVVDAWGDQLSERDERLESARRDERAHDDAAERERQKAVEEDRRQLAEARDRERAAADILKEQMEQLKVKDVEAEMLRREQDALTKRQWQLDDIEQERKRMDAERKKSELGRFLTKQYKAQLRRRHRQIQEELSLDRQILESLLSHEEQGKEAETSRREKARADVEWMKTAVESQLRVERQREADLDLMYRDEAHRMWEKREQEWTKERRARERLMSEVLDERRAQVLAHVDANRDRQQRSLKEREQLVEELDVLNQITRREKQDEFETQKQRKVAIDAQIQDREQQQLTARQQVSEDLSKQLRFQSQYDDMVTQEETARERRGFQPKTYPRPGRFAWQ